MNGYKTYTGVLMILFGYLQSRGIIPHMSDETMVQVVDGIMVIIGTAIAIYGRIHVGERLEKAEMENKLLESKIAPVESTIE